MSKFRPMILDHDHHATVDDIGLLEWLTAVPQDGVPGPSIEGTDDPWTGLSLGLDGVSSGDGATIGDGQGGDVHTDAASNRSSDGPDFAASPDGPGGNGPVAARWGGSFSENVWIGDWQGGPSADGPAGTLLTAPDLIFLDTQPYARGGNAKGGGGGGKGGGKGGGGNDSGGGETTVLSKYMSGDVGGYNIEIDFKGTWTTDLQRAFIDSSELISDIILGDITDVFYRGKVIDDIRIDAELTYIDGVGGILGQAGPTAVRTADYLPATAVMEFDSADADAYNQLGLWDDIVLHEMMHSIGFGTVWSYKGLISGAGTDTPIFTGDGAVMTYEYLFNASGAAGVPVEGDGGQGTRDSHWDEETFDNEIMTGYIDTTNYMSDMTIASLEDLGYDTTWTADEYLIA